MNKYYSSDSLRYPSLIKDGVLSWDGDKTLEEYLFIENVHIYEKALALIGKKNIDVLVLGCGTGKQTSFFAQSGCRVTGIDLSSDAIELANKLAIQLDLKINYVCVDNLEFVKNHREKFDLIVDAHMFHCICFKEERKSFLRDIHHCLRESGAFVVDTMIFRSDMSLLNDSHYIYQNDTSILWYKLSSPSMLKGITMINDCDIVPQRYIALFEKIKEELVAADFKFFFKEEVVQSPGEPGLGLFICQKK